MSVRMGYITISKQDTWFWFQWINHILSQQLYSLVPRPKEKWPDNFCEFKLHTDVTSWQLQYLIQIVYCMWYLQFFQLWDWGFPARGSNCLLSILLMKWNRSHLNKIVMQSAYTSAIEQSLLKRNGCNCNSSMHYTISFCHVTTFWNLIGTANFQVAEVTVWTRGSCQAIFPTAWKWG